jgi:hypothetical protein
MKGFAATAAQAGRESYQAGALDVPKPWMRWHAIANPAR